MRLEDVLAVIASLEEEDVRYAVIGAMALAAHGLDRATRDLDLFVDPSADNVARLRRALRRVFDDPSIDEITAEDLGGEYPAIQYGPPDAAFTIDIVSRLGEAFSFDDLDVVTVQAGDRPMRVVTPRTLYRMKRDTVRPHDHRRRAPAQALRRGGLRVPVHKHRRVEDLPEQTPAASATEGLAAACALAELTARIGTTRAAPRGVRRFTSVQEADRHRQEWELGPEA